MFATKALIAVTVVGSVLMDSNLKEFCSAKYFHSFDVQYENTNRYHFQFYRRSDSNSYHLWRLQMEEQPSVEGFKLIDMTYELEGGQTPNRRPLSQPRECFRQMNSGYNGFRINEFEVPKGIFNWPLNNIRIVNDKAKGPQLQYTQTLWRYYIEKGLTRKLALKTKNGTEKKTIPLKSSGIWLNGLLCRVSDRTIFTIFEANDSLNSTNRIQFMGRLRIENNLAKIVPNFPNTERIILPNPEFSLELSNKTIVEFFGIQCPDIDESETGTLWLIIWCLIVSGAIFAITDIWLIITRNRPQEPQDMPNSDRESDLTSSPGESTTKISATESETV